MKPALIEITSILNHSPVEYLRALSGVSFFYGTEHAKFVDAFMQKAGVNTPPEALIPMFRDEGRFHGQILMRDYLQSPVDFSVAGKLIDHKSIPPLTGIGKIKDLRCFLGKSGDRSSLHFDWNPYPNILFNLTGTKKIKLFPPEASRVLKGYANFSFYQGEEESQTFILNAGEALLIPAWWWHEVEYQSLACSLSIRLDDIPETIPSLEGLYPTWKMLLAKKNPGIDIEKNLNHIIGHDPAEDHEFYLSWIKGYLLFNNGVMTS